MIIARPGDWLFVYPQVNSRTFGTIVFLVLRVARNLKDCIEIVKYCSIQARVFKGSIRWR